MLAPAELIVAVEVPFLKTDERDGFLELARREGDYAMIGLAARGSYGERSLFLVVAGLFRGRRPADPGHRALPPR